MFSTFKAVSDMIGFRLSLKLQNNTYLVRRESESDPEIWLMVHDNPILKFKPDSVTYDSCGWKTKLTRTRLSEYAPFRIHCSRKEWTIIGPQNTLIPFFDGIKISWNGEQLLTCPNCGKDVWDLPHGHKLAKCWNCGIAFDTIAEE